MFKKALGTLIYGISRLGKTFNKNLGNNETSFEEDIQSGIDLATLIVLTLQMHGEMSKGASAGSKSTNNSAQSVDDLVTVSDDLFNIAFKSIKTPRGLATQAATTRALQAGEEVLGGAKLYRVGTLGKSHTADAQFWSLSNPAKIKDINTFALRYGIPPENVSNGEFFIEVGTLKPGCNFVTRPAPGGTAIEVVTDPGGVKLESFHTFKFKQ